MGRKFGPGILFTAVYIGPGAVGLCDLEILKVLATVGCGLMSLLVVRSGRPIAQDVDPLALVRTASRSSI